MNEHEVTNSEFQQLVSETGYVAIGKKAMLI
ncbi:MAG: hypothetical protein ACJAR3_002521 [Roseivirga sp.]|jgi:hypothetical protein